MVIPLRSGRASHFTKRGELLIRCKKAPRIGSRAFLQWNKKKFNFGEVIDVIGPVKRPWAKVRVRKGIKSNKLLGKIVFFE